MQKREYLKIYQMMLVLKRPFIRMYERMGINEYK